MRTCPIFPTPRSRSRRAGAAEPRAAAGGAIVIVLTALLAGRLPAAGAGIDLSTPGMKQLREACDREIAGLDARRAAGLKALVAKNLDAARRMLAEKKRAGNVSGIVSGRKAISIFEACAAQLEQEKDFTLPGKVRRDLAAVIDACAAGKQALDEEHAAAARGTREQFYAAFLDQVNAQAATPPAETALRALFTELMTGDPAPGPQPPGRTGAEDEQEEAKEDRPPDPDAGRRVIDASRRPAASDWVTLAYWYAEVNGLEMIPVSVMQRRELHEDSGTGMMTRSPFKTRYEPMRVLVPGETYAFRALTVPGRVTVDVAEWPAADNDWTLLLRTRPPGGRVPSEHGVEIQVASPAAGGLEKVAGGGVPQPQAPAAEPEPTLQVPVTTHPEGALVYVNRRLYRPGREVVRTPCRVPMAAGANHVTLRLTGYMDGVIEQFIAGPDRQIRWRFEKNPDVTDKTVPLSARTAAWRTTGVAIGKGDLVSIRPSGEWACGNGGEAVDSLGYPNNEEFYKYYLNPQKNPRQLPGANYGALLARIGPQGTLKPVGRGLRFVAEEAGMLYLDINEKPDARARRDNKGNLTVRIRAVPGSGVKNQE